MIPKATCSAKDMVLPGAVYKWPLLEHDPECMVYRDMDPPMPVFQAHSACVSCPTLAFGLTSTGLTPYTESPYS